MINHGKIANTFSIVCPYKLPVSHNKALFASIGFRISRNCTIAVQIAPIANPISAKLDPFTLNLDMRIDKIKLIHSAPINEPTGNKTRVLMENHYKYNRS